MWAYFHQKDQMKLALQWIPFLKNCGTARRLQHYKHRMPTFRILDADGHGSRGGESWMVFASIVERTMQRSMDASSSRVDAIDHDSQVDAPAVRTHQTLMRHLTRDVYLICSVSQPVKQRTIHLILLISTSGHLQAFSWVACWNFQRAVNLAVKFLPVKRQHSIATRKTCLGRALVLFFLGFGLDQEDYTSTFFFWKDGYTSTLACSHHSWLEKTQTWSSYGVQYSLIQILYVQKNRKQ